MNTPNTLMALHGLGQSFWWDQLSRREIQDGSVERMRDDNGMRGITSNPSIFQKSLADGDVYDADAAKLFGQGLDTEAVFWRLAVDDIRRACTILRPVYDESGGEDGFVSLEVDPRLAHDTEKTLGEVRRLWGEVDEPNLMIKIPGTPEGVPAIRQALTEGVNVNVTLLFSPQAHVDVMHAYLDAIEARHEKGESIRDMASVNRVAIRQAADRIRTANRTGGTAWLAAAPSPLSTHAAGLSRSDPGVLRWWGTQQASGGVGPRDVFIAFGTDHARMSVCCVALGGAVYGMHHLLPAVPGFTGELIAAGVPVVAGGVTYLAFAVLLGLPDGARLGTLLRRK